MHQLTGDFYTVGEVLGHTLAGIGASLGLSMNFEAVTARYVDVRLEGAHAALLLSAAETEAAEHAVPALLEVTDLHEAGLDGVPQTNGDEQRDQNVVGQVAVDLLHNGEKRFSHGKFPPKNIVPRFSSSSRFADKAKNRAAEEIDSPDPSSHP